jgi:hypothetical protein
VPLGMLDLGIDRLFSELALLRRILTDYEGNTDFHTQ